MPAVLLLLLASVLLAGWTISIYLSYGSQLAERSSENKRLRDELEQVTPDMGQLAEFKSMERDTSALRTAVDKMNEDRQRHAVLLEEIFLMAPAGMGLTEIETIPGNIRIAGFCFDYTMLGGLLSAADVHPRLGRVYSITSSHTQSTGRQMEFVIKAECKGAGK